MAPLHRRRAASASIGRGQGRKQLSAYSRTLGTFEVDGDRLVLHAKRGVSWDSFYGVDSPEHEVQSPASYGGPNDDMHYQVLGGRLVLRYLSYPADAPVLTTRLFFRER